MLLFSSLGSKHNLTLLFGFSTTIKEFTHSVGSVTFLMTLIFSSLLSSFFTLFFSAYGIFLGGLTTSLAFLSKRILYCVSE